SKPFSPTPPSAPCRRRRRKPATSKVKCRMSKVRTSHLRDLRLPQLGTAHQRPLLHLQPTIRLLHCGPQPPRHQCLVATCPPRSPPPDAPFSPLLTLGTARLPPSHPRPSPSSKSRPKLSASRRKSPSAAASAAVSAASPHQN